MLATVMLFSVTTIISPRIFSQCTSSGFKSGSVFLSDNSTGVYDFSTPSNAQTSDNSRTSAAALITLLSGNTYYLEAKGFNFTIPSYAAICGVTVEVEKRASGIIILGSVTDNVVRLIKNGVITGSNKAKSGSWSSSDSYSSYGGATDLWGTTLTPEDVNSPNFGIAFSATIGGLLGTLPSADIDHIRINMSYNFPVPLVLESFDLKQAGNLIDLSWKTTEEETGGSIELQRSANNGNDWTILQTISITNNSEGKAYSYKDYLNTKGIYTYRLKLSSPGGKTDYSIAKLADYRQTAGINVYPNPAAGYLMVTNLAKGETITILSTTASIIIQQAVTVENGITRLDISSLPPGMYFLKAGTKVMKFVKD